MSKFDELMRKKDSGVNFYKLKDLVEFFNGKGHENVVEVDGNYIIITSKAISTNMKIVRKTNKSLTPLKNIPLKQIADE